jgi:hypothetical protein
MNAKTSQKCKSGEIITGHINPEIVFRLALVLANSRYDVTIDNILSHPVGPIPVSISADLMKVFFTSYRSNTSATVCAFAKHDVNCLQ